MLNQVPRTLLTIGSANGSGPSESNGSRLHYVGGSEGMNGGRGHVPLSTPRHSSHGSLTPSFRSEDSVPPPGPASSSGRKRVPSMDRASRRRGMGAHAGRGGSGGSLEEFTNDSIADAALRDFGENVSRGGVVRRRHGGLVWSWSTSSSCGWLTSSLGVRVTCWLSGVHSNRCCDRRIT